MLFIISIKNIYRYQKMCSDENDNMWTIFLATKTHIVGSEWFFFCWDLGEK